MDQPRLIKGIQAVVYTGGLSVVWNEMLFDILGIRAGTRRRPTSSNVCGINVTPRLPGLPFTRSWSREIVNSILSTSILVAVGFCNVAFFVRFVLQIPRRARPFDVEKEGIVDASESTGVVVCGGPLPKSPHSESYPFQTPYPSPTSDNGSLSNHSGGRCCQCPSRYVPSPISGWTS